MGLPGFMNGDFKYHKIVADIYHNFNFGGLGNIVYDLSFTKVFGQLPYPLLVTLAGNQSVFITSHTYNLMNYGEFVLDEALEMSMTYHMNGLIMNKLPLLKKLGLRTVVGARAAFGSFNDKLNGFYDPVINRTAILPDSIRGNSLTRFNTLSYDRPYAELSYGIENIFRFLRVDLIQRLTWLENPNLHRFGVKISGVFRF
jgi:peptidoglycan/xylan/chitin deacetylase (PgdA/CDA1 family)